MINNTGIVIIFFLSLILSFIATKLITRISLSLGIVDQPGERRSHHIPTPRGGGMGFVLVFLIFFPIGKYFFDISSELFWPFYVCCGMISLLGLLDDISSLSRKLRFGVWIAVSMVAVLWGLSIETIDLPILGKITFGLLSPLITFLWLIGVTNFFNFMDGINGLAGLEAIVVTLFLGIAAYQAGNNLIFLASGILFWGVFGFLPENFPEAKVFMGDGASNFLGFALAGLTILGSQSQEASIPFLLPVILLVLFLLDAGITLLKRIPKRKEWLEPHRDHYYQRLTDLGLSHSQVSLLYTGLNLILGFLALLYSRLDGWAALLVLLCSLLPFLFLDLLKKKLERG